MVTYGEIDALNWSSLKHASTSLRLYRWRQTHPRPDTAALSMGRAIHAAILEPEEYSARYCVRPDGLDLRTRAGKEWRDSVGDCDVLPADKAAVIEQCARSVAECREAVALLEGTEREVPLTWQIDGVDCKGRLDALKRSALIDVKTCRTLEWFPRDSATYLYHGQLAWYRDGAVAAKLLDEDAETYVIAVETSEPYDVIVYRYPSWVIEVGRRLYFRLLADVRVAEHTGQWPGRAEGIVDMDLPRWADPAAGDYEWGE